MPDAGERALPTPLGAKGNTPFSIEQKPKLLLSPPGMYSFVDRTPEVEMDSVLPAPFGLVVGQLLMYQLASKFPVCVLKTSLNTFAPQSFASRDTMLESSALVSLDSRNG